MADLELVQGEQPAHHLDEVLPHVALAEARALLLVRLHLLQQVAPVRELHHDAQHRVVLVEERLLVRDHVRVATA